MGYVCSKTKVNNPINRFKDLNPAETVLRSVYLMEKSVKVPCIKI